MIKCGFQNQVEEQAEGIAEIKTRKGRCARNRTCEKTNDRAKHESAVVRKNRDLKPLFKVVWLLNNRSCMVATEEPESVKLQLTLHFACRHDPPN